MGLPYFITPTEPDTAAKPQAEKSAARARSSIRRQPRSARPRVDIAGRFSRMHRVMEIHRALEVESRREERSSSIDSTDPPAPPVARTPGDALEELWPETDDGGVAAVSAALARARAEIVDLHPPPPPHIPSYRPDPPMPAVPESGDYISSARRSHLRHSHDSTNDLRREYRMARRRALAMQMEEADDATSRLGTGSSNLGTTLVRTRIIRPGDLSDFPPLNRVGPRTIIAAELNPRSSESRRFRQTPIPRGLNGLGDRDRSLSPDHDGAWETIRTTMTPDPQPPSVSSSFVSAVASSSVNPGSVNTSMTTVGSTDDAAANACDVSDSNASDTDQDEDETDMYETRNSIIMTEPHWVSYGNVVEPSGFPVSRRDEPELGLGSWQRIVARLARREDIPDEWWAEAGLSRTLRRESSTS